MMMFIWYNVDDLQHHSLVICKFALNAKYSWCWWECHIYWKFKTWPEVSARRRLRWDAEKLQFRRINVMALNWYFILNLKCQTVGGAKEKVRRAKSNCFLKGPWMFFTIILGNPAIQGILVWTKLLDRPTDWPSILPPLEPFSYHGTQL